MQSMCRLSGLVGPVKSTVGFSLILHPIVYAQTAARTKCKYTGNVNIKLGLRLNFILLKGVGCRGEIKECVFTIHVNIFEMIKYSIKYYEGIRGPYTSN